MKCIFAPQFGGKCTLPDVHIGINYNRPVVFAMQGAAGDGAGLPAERHAGGSRLGRGAAAAAHLPRQDVIPQEQRIHERKERYWLGRVHRLWPFHGAFASDALAGTVYAIGGQGAAVRRQSPCRKPKLLQIAVIDQVMLVAAYTCIAMRTESCFVGSADSVSTAYRTRRLTL